VRKRLPDVPLEALSMLRRVFGPEQPAKVLHRLWKED
jgi:hypothetical protein